MRGFMTKGNSKIYIIRDSETSSTMLLTSMPRSYSLLKSRIWVMQLKQLVATILAPVSRICSAFFLPAVTRILPKSPLEASPPPPPQQKLRARLGCISTRLDVTAFKTLRGASMIPPRRAMLQGSW